MAQIWHSADLALATESSSSKAPALLDRGRTGITRTGHQDSVITSYSRGMHRLGPEFGSGSRLSERRTGPRTPALEFVEHFFLQLHFHPIRISELTDEPLHDRSGRGDGAIDPIVRNLNVRTFIEASYLEKE